MYTTIRRNKSQTLVTLFYLMPRVLKIRTRMLHLILYFTWINIIHTDSVQSSLHVFYALCTLCTFLNLCDSLNISLNRNNIFSFLSLRREFPKSQVNLSFSYVYTIIPSIEINADRMWSTLVSIHSFSDKGHTWKISTLIRNRIKNNDNERLWIVSRVWM